MSQWSKEEMKEVRDKLVKKEKEIVSIKEEFHNSQKKNQVIFHVLLHLLIVIVDILLESY